MNSKPEKYCSVGVFLSAHPKVVAGPSPTLTNHLCWYSYGS